MSRPSSTSEIVETGVMLQFERDANGSGGENGRHTAEDGSLRHRSRWFFVWQAGPRTMVVRYIYAAIFLVASFSAWAVRNGNRNIFFQAQRLSGCQGDRDCLTAEAVLIISLTCFVSFPDQHFFVGWDTRHQTMEKRWSVDVGWVGTWVHIANEALVVVSFVATLLARIYGIAWLQSLLAWIFATGGCQRPSGEEPEGIEISTRRRPPPNLPEDVHDPPDLPASAQTTTEIHDLILPETPSPASQTTTTDEVHEPSSPPSPAVSQTMEAAVAGDAGSTYRGRCLVFSSLLFIFLFFFFFFFL